MEFDDEWSHLLREINHAMVGSLTEGSYESAPEVVADIASSVFAHVAACLDLDDWQYAQAQALFLCLARDNHQEFFVVYGEDILIPGGVERDFQGLDQWFSSLESHTMGRRAQELLDHYGSLVDDDTREHWKMLAQRRDSNANH